ncbi:hypothetical protein DEO72_LG10g2493 [Vigna unguiculata]|uniref:Uncharacterized protein n=1 Tax=Vigna unguiculata TaxID=3917 RepID=A0A4D6NBI8_VIGUN|nr:hypothetical protein DEO72_LG10g2493 [Vigna unguiculata]
MQISVLDEVQKPPPHLFISPATTASPSRHLVAGHHCTSSSTDQQPLAHHYEHYNSPETAPSLQNHHTTNFSPPWTNLDGSRFTHQQPTSHCSDHRTYNLHYEPATIISPPSSTFVHHHAENANQIGERFHLRASIISTDLHRSSVTTRSASNHGSTTSHAPDRRRRTIASATLPANQNSTTSMAVTPRWQPPFPQPSRTIAAAMAAIAPPPSSLVGEEKRQQQPSQQLCSHSVRETLV